MYVWPIPKHPKTVMPPRSKRCALTEKEYDRLIVRLEAGRSAAIKELRDAYFTAASRCKAGDYERFIDETKLITHSTWEKFLAELEGHSNGPRIWIPRDYSFIVPMYGTHLFKVVPDATTRALNEKGPEGDHLICIARAAEDNYRTVRGDKSEFASIVQDVAAWIFARKLAMSG